MQTRTVQTYVGADGLLKLALPIGMTNVDVEVVLTVHPLTVHPRSHTPTPPLTLAQLIGAIDDPTFVRHPQGEYPQRETLE